MPLINFLDVLIRTDAKFIVISKDSAPGQRRLESHISPD